MHKIEDLLHKEIASIIISRIDNQDVKNTVTITDIKVSKDIRSAIVYFTTLKNEFKKIYPNEKVSIVVAGGVAANQKIKKIFFNIGKENNYNIYLSLIHI